MSVLLTMIDSEWGGARLRGAGEKNLELRLRELENESAIILKNPMSSRNAENTACW